VPHPKCAARAVPKHCCGSSAPCAAQGRDRVFQRSTPRHALSSRCSIPSCFLGHARPLHGTHFSSHASSLSVPSPSPAHIIITPTDRLTPSTPTPFLTLTSPPIDSLTPPPPIYTLRALQATLLSCMDHPTPAGSADPQGPLTTPAPTCRSATSAPTATPTIPTARPAPTDDGPEAHLVALPTLTPHGGSPGDIL
jgi:hypothetical protein